MKLKTCDVLVVFSFTIISVLLFWERNWFGSINGDVAGYAYHMYVFSIQALENYELPLWIPYFWGGITGFSSISTQFYPITYLVIGVISVFGENGLGAGSLLQCGASIHLAILQIGMYFMCRTINMPRWNAYLSAILCGISGCAIIHLNYWPSLGNAIAWIPFLLMIVIRISRKTSKNTMFCGEIVGGGVVFSLILLSGLGQGPVFAVLCWAIFYFCSLVYMYKDIPRCIRFTLSNLATGVLGVMLAAINVIPILLEQKMLVRSASDQGFLYAGEKMSYTSFTEDTLSISRVIQILGSYTVDFTAISIIVCILALIGFCTIKKTNEEKVLLLFARIIVVYVILGGLSFGVTDYLYYIPLINQIRQPLIYSLTFSIALIILVSTGIDTIYRCWFEKCCNYKEVIYNYKIIGGIIVLLIIRVILPHNISYQNVTAITILLLFFVLGKIWKNFLWTKQVGMLMLAVVIVSNILFYREALDLKEHTCSEVDEQYELVQESVKQLFDATEYPTSNNMFRVTKYAALEVYSKNIMEHIGGYDIAGYWNPIYSKTIEKHLNCDLEKRMQLENVKYWFILEEETAVIPEKAGFEYLCSVDNVYPSYDATEGNTVLVYENSNYLGPAWFVYEYQIYSEELEVEEIYELLDEATLDLSKTALVDEDTAEKLENIQSTDVQGDVELIEYTSNKITYECSTESIGLLMVTESDAQGWTAYVDGEKREILSVNYDRKGIVIYPGETEVVLSYCPSGFVAGAIISITTIVGLIIYGGYVLLVARSKRKKGESYENNAK